MFVSIVNPEQTVARYDFLFKQENIIQIA